MRVSEDGRVVDFGYRGSAGPVLRFDVRSLTLSSPPPNDGLTFAPNREGLTIDGWRNGTSPTLNGRALPFDAVRHRAKPRDRSGRQALLPRLELRPHGVRRRGNAEMAMAESERGLGGERQQGRARRRHGRRRRRDPLASRRRRTRASGLAGPSEQEATRPSGTGCCGRPKASTRRRPARRTC